VKTIKSHAVSTDKRTEIPVNPFIKAIEEKTMISNAIKAGKPLSDLKGIRFVKPL
jgi:hypothetical protein